MRRWSWRDLLRRQRARQRVSMCQTRYQSNARRTWSCSGGFRKQTRVLADLRVSRYTESGAFPEQPVIGYHRSVIQIACFTLRSGRHVQAR